MPLALPEALGVGFSGSFLARAVTLSPSLRLETPHRLEPVVPMPARRSPSIFPFVFPAYLAVAVLLQFAAGAFHQELSGLPDEPAHYVTGLMVREYLATDFPHHPMKFAESYYLHYPKVALGHWPPVFYVMEAVWTLVFPYTRPSVLILMALLTALLATSVAWYVRKLAGTKSAVAVGLLFTVMPLVQAQTGMIMVELLLTLFSFLAAIAYGSYARSESWQPAFWFGVFASLAILTKGDGWALALIPPIVIALTRKFYLLKRFSFWLSALIVVACCAPWQLYTLGMAKQGWVGTGPNLRFTLTAASKFLDVLWHTAGPLFFLFAIVGIAVKILVPWWRGRVVTGPYASMFALLVAVTVFHSVVPVTIESRRMVMDFPGLLIFIPAGIFWTSRKLARTSLRSAARPAVLAGVATVLFVALDFYIPAKRSFGFLETARDLVKSGDAKGSAFLVSSEADGEGLLVAELAMLQPEPTHFVLRANKLLARVNWNGDRYETRFHSPAAVMQQLDRVPVDTLIIDRTPGPAHLEHHALLLKMLEENPREWKLMGNYGPANAAVKPVWVYRRINPDSRRPNNIKVDLTQTLNRILEQ